jgi:hypothetical protein
MSLMEHSYEEARATLMGADGKPSPRYQAYMKFQEDYKARICEMNQAYQDALSNPMKLQSWPMFGKTWIVLGHKHDIENAIAVLMAQAGNEGRTLVAQLEQQFTASRSSSAKTT